MHLHLPAQSSRLRINQMDSPISGSYRKHPFSSELRASVSKSEQREVCPPVALLVIGWLERNHFDQFGLFF